MLKLNKKHIVRDANLELITKPRKQDFCTNISWKVENRDTNQFQGVIELAIPIPNDFRHPWIMIPAYLYGESKTPESETKHQKNYPVWDPSLDTPTDMTSSWWITPADRTASPLVYLHENDTCFAVAAEPHFETKGEVSSEDSEPQIGIGFGTLKDDATIKVTVPACEEPFTHNNTLNNGPTIRQVTMEPNSSVSGRIMIFDFKGDRHSYQRILEYYYREMSVDNPPASLPELNSLVDDAIYGIVNVHYHPQGNYFAYSRTYDPLPEQIANARGCSLEWHQMMIGFVNGFVICHALLKGAELLDGVGAETLVDCPVLTPSQPKLHARELALRVAEKICMGGISPSGLFWADWMPERIVTDNINIHNPLYEDRNPWGSGWLQQKTWVHSRTIADACDHLAGMILLESADNSKSDHVKMWTNALKKNIDTVLDLQLGNGSYGQYYDAVDKKVVKDDGCGGLLWIPALIKSIEIFSDNPELTGRIEKSLHRAADAYAGYVEEEYIWGAPEDNNSPTSEDGLNAVMAYCDLYEFFNEPHYLELAKIAADWMLTFRKTYNQRLPENTLMGKYGLRSMGGDFASVANSHLHVFEALCTRHLGNLSRWIGNEYYQKRAYEHWTFVCQYLSRCDGMFNGFRGAMAEQFYWTDWGSWGDWQPPAYHHQKGNLGAVSTIWCIAVILLAASDAKQEFYQK